MADVSLGKLIFGRLTSTHSRVNTETGIAMQTFPSGNKREATMPFLFYLPLIIWTGLLGVAQQPARVPVKSKRR